MLERIALGSFVVTVALGCARAAPVAAPMIQLPVDSVSGQGVETSARAEGGRTIGERVEVEWHGSWFPAVLVERRGAEWLIHYEGYTEDDDEVVPLARIRDPRGRAATDEEDDR